MSVPHNLAQQAVLDYTTLVRRSLRDFGAAAAKALSDKLLAQFRKIEEGVAVGRRHPDIPFREAIRCVTVKPVLVFYDERTRVVVRVIDGRRDLPRLFADDR